MNSNFAGLSSQAHHSGHYLGARGIKTEVGKQLRIDLRDWLKRMNRTPWSYQSVKEDREPPKIRAYINDVISRYDDPSDCIAHVRLIPTEKIQFVVNSVAEIDMKSKTVVDRNRSRLRKLRRELKS
jgi:hypothetical protein